MYRAFFGFKEKPFNLTPDPKFLYLNASYREALASLHYGVVDRKGFVSLIGEAGTGKTTLLRRLLSELPHDTRSVLVINPAIGFEEMLRFILSDLGRAPAPGATKLEMLEALNAELLDTLARGGNVVVLIDEAQDLTIAVLEELRLLSNLETAKEKILQLVLAGQPELDGVLAQPAIRQLRQRIAVCARLRPLSRAEVRAYVAARIAVAGGDARGLFTPAALFRLWWFSGGVPRLVNAACDNALVTAYATGRRSIGWREIGEAVRDLRGREVWVPGAFRYVVRLLATAAFGGGLLLGAIWLARQRFDGPVLRIAPPRPVPFGEATSVPVGGDALPIAASPSPSTAEMVSAEALGANGAAAGGKAVVAVLTPTGPMPTPELVRGTTAGPAGEPSANESPKVRSSGGDLRIRISPGDTLTDLARRYYGNSGPRTLETIRAANPWLGDPDVLDVGEFLLLPAPRFDGSESSGARGGDH